MNNTFEEIRSLINSSGSIAISGHTSPDGDAVGACAALGMSLKEMGKEIKIILEPYSETFSVIPTGGLVSNDVDDGYLPELYISLDCGDKERLGKNKAVFEKAGHTINIDHHKSNTFFGELNYVEENSSSTCEIVFRLINGYYPVNADIAAAIYTGLVFDTGGFRHTSTGASTLKAAGELLEYDFDFNKIYNSIFFSRRFEEAKIMGTALTNLKLYYGGAVAASYATGEEMKACGAVSDDVSEISGYLKGIINTEVSVFVYEKEHGVFKASMRSENGVDVSKIAVMFGGGGHAKAAGCTVCGKEIDVVLKNILDKIGEEL
ncbi:bifunctional oligoribonuclease/PAP phosphatase NrnA [Anaerotignum faecicola]|nr:bifunctional oligoribonuclease/PAP phosphatase NrnA [Anaerotignum faecicola]